MEALPVPIGSHTKFIISTSGRLSSLKRYNYLLQQSLHQDIVYIPINSGSDELPQISPERFAFALKGMPCIGGAISKDIKHSIIPYLDVVDEDAAKIQSVNTVIVRSGKLYGYNTDVIGFRKAIVSGIASLSVKSAVCYGYGGVISVVVTVLKELGLQVYITGRRPEEAARRAVELGIEPWLEGVQCDLFVNAAPVTDKPLEEAANLLPALTGCKAAFDHEMPGVYLKSYCEEHNIHHISGYDMYYPQMFSQWSLFLESLQLDAGLLQELLLDADQKSKK